jgi:SAM-dependent methyltransferase
MGLNLKARWTAYTEPLYLLSISLLYLPVTALYHPFLLIKSPSAFRSKWFEVFWRAIGPKMAAAPLQVDNIESLLSRAHGVVLELGPGGGDQSYHFKPEKISWVYGAEPNAFLHDILLQKSEEAGFCGKYTPLTAAAEPGSLLPALTAAGLIPSNSSGLPPEGIFDSIIAVKALCSAPQAQLPATIAVIQALLKPGGEFLFFEHLGNNSDTITQGYAWLLDWVWPAVMGGCRLNGKLDSVIMGMGGWAKRDIRTTGNYEGFEVFRYAKGICEKA